MYGTSVRRPQLMGCWGPDARGTVGMGSLCASDRNRSVGFYVLRGEYKCVLTQYPLKGLY